MATTIKYLKVGTDTYQFDPFPSQTNQNGKVLKTNGSNVYWGDDATGSGIQPGQSTYLSSLHCIYGFSFLGPASTPHYRAGYQDDLGFVLSGQIPLVIEPPIIAQGGIWLKDLIDSDDIGVMVIDVPFTVIGPNAGTEAQITNGIVCLPCRCIPRI